MNMADVDAKASDAASWDIFRSDAFMDSLSEGILLVGRSGRILRCNATALELLGVSRDDIEGRSISDPLWGAVHEDGSLLQASEFPASVALRTGQPCLDMIIGIDIPGDGRRWLTTSSQVITTEDGMVGANCSFVNVTATMAMRRALSTFTYLSNVITSALPPEDLLVDLCHGIVDIGGYALAWVGSRGAVGSEGEFDVSIVAAAGRIDFLEEGVSSSQRRDLTGIDFTARAMETRQIQVANDLARRINDEPWRIRARDFGFGSVLALPILVGDDLLAVLTVYGREASAFDGPSEELLTKFAAAFSLGMVHARDIAKLAESFDATMAVIGKMSEIRDPWTAGHQHNVANLGSAIAERMGLEPNLADIIHKAGDTHDIGKFSVPTEILTRPGRLEPEEFALIRRHPIVGGAILADAGVPQPIIDVAMQHHERLDGSGYPAGLVGEAICLPARIIAVADVIEAMTHHRPYRPGFAVEVALDEITKGSGTIYDAAAVAACLELFADGFSF